MQMPEIYCMHVTENQLTRKWTSNHPPIPQSLVCSAVIEDETLALMLRMSSTVVVEQSISFIIAGLPKTCFG